MALKAHNGKRTDHCATDYTLDDTMAKAMQSMLNAEQTPTDPAGRPEPYRECLENFYTAPAGTSKNDVRDKNLATDYWYAMKNRYNFQTGIGSPKNEAD